MGVVSVKREGSDLRQTQVPNSSSAEQEEAGQVRATTPETGVPMYRSGASIKSAMALGIGSLSGQTQMNRNLYPSVVSRDRILQ